MQQPEQRQDNQFNFADSVNLTYFVADCLATCLTLFIRRNYGTQAFGFNAVAAFVILLLVASDANDLLMTWMWISWCILLIVHRVQTFQNWRRGIRLHSQYAGDPTIAMRFLRDPAHARWLEPFLCLGVAVCMIPFSQITAAFVFWGAVALLVRTSMDREVHRKRVRHLLDAEIEQEFLVEQWQRQRRKS